MESTQIRIPSLDGLRTISIALVLIGHSLHLYGFGSYGSLGNLGVRVFFVISGFLITGLLVREIERTSSVNLLKFYFRRTLRIFPPYYFYLIVVSLAVLLGLTEIPGSSLLFAAAYLTDYIHPNNWLLGHTWSLAVEEQFYLILPGLLLLLGIARAKLMLILIVLILPVLRIVDFHLSGAEQVWVIKGFHANTDALAIGCLLTLFRTALQRSKLYLRFLGRPWVFLLLPLIFLANVQHDHPHILLGFSFTFINISAALFIDWAVTNCDTAVGRFLNSAVMVKLGMMSYSIYLWQQPFLDPTSGMGFTIFPYNIAGIAIMSMISYHLVERYSLRLRQTWESKLFTGKRSTDDNSIPATAAVG